MQEDPRHDEGLLLSVPPWSVTGSAAIATPLMSSVALGSTDVPALLAPRAPTLSTWSVPALMVVVPS